jgi:DNA-3-methyladenine glycosylase II
VREQERKAAYRHLRRELPFMAHLIERTGELPLPIPTNGSVAASLVNIVAGQMLSRLAAQTILRRMAAAAERSGAGHLYHLSEEELRACGLSGRKARTVAAIRDLDEKERDRLEGWRQLAWLDLRREVSTVWGLSDWSAGVLAIFDFALPDVFPLGDGSLLRAMRLVERLHMGDGAVFPHERGSPYGSYLAITLWAALDSGHLTDPKRV